MENKKPLIAIISIIVVVIAGVALTMSLRDRSSTPGRQGGTTSDNTVNGSNSSNTSTAQLQPVEVVPGTYTVDTSRSSLTWRGEKVVGSSHNGTVAIRSGSLQTERDQFARGEFVIDMTTIASPDSEQLVNHLKSDDFFSVSSYPTAKFVFTGIQHEAGNQYLVTGNLTLKGQTHTIAFPTTLKQVADGYVADATFTIDRTKWDIRYGSGKFFDNLGDNIVKDEIQLTLHLEAFNEALMQK